MHGYGTAAFCLDVLLWRAALFRALAVRMAIDLSIKEKVYI